MTGGKTSSSKIPSSTDEIIQRLGLPSLHSLQELDDLTTKLKRERESFKGKTVVVAG
jgi:hypothetical protein